jgi:hypothetical protein
VRPRRSTGGRVVAAIVLALGTAGCGNSVLSTAQMRTDATRICRLTANQTSAIVTPADPNSGERFLSRGVAALAREVVELHALRTTPAFADAVDGTAAEVAALRFSLKGLRSGNDPVVTIKTLQQQLAPLELRSSRAWGALGVPACASR